MSISWKDIQSLRAGDTVKIIDVLGGYTYSDFEPPAWRRYLGKDAVISDIELRPNQQNCVFTFEGIRDRFHSDYISQVVFHADDFAPIEDISSLFE